MTKTQPHVAVVDDEEPIRKALMRLMRSAGLSVETFASGPEFLESLDTRLPDCVVLDLHMPHMNGFNVQAHLAQKHAALPVIIFTGHDFPNARERAMQGGASAFLCKPVLDRTLLGAISAATSSAQPGGSPNGHGVFSELRSPIPGERERVRDGNINPNRNFPERPHQRPPEQPIQMSWIATGMAGPGQPKKEERIKVKPPNKIKPNRSKCIWTACIAAMAVCMTMSARGDSDPANLGDAYISNVTGVNGECVQSTIDGQTQKWDIQANGTYMVTLSNVTDCANYGGDPTIQVIVKNSGGGNFCTTTAVSTATGVYTFQVPLTTQCKTLPILYCTTGCDTNTGLFARDALAGHEGHLRTSTFDADCTHPVEDVTCNGGATPTPTPLPKASITACKFYDQNADGIKQTTEPYLAGWPIGICPLDGAPEQQTQTTGGSGCVIWTNLTIPGDYTVTEATANESNWFHSPDPMPPPLIVNGTSTIVFPTVGETGTRTFGNYCTSPSGGLTLGFWSNKNGQKILTGSTTGPNLLGPVVTLLNSCQLRNANGSVHTFTSSYSLFRSWLLGATATNMAYMLSAQLATLKLDLLPPTGYGSVDGNAYDLCSSMTINALITTACDQLAMDGYTISGNPTRVAQEMLKNCIDKINNGGDVVPVTPCPHTFPSATPCP